MFKLISGISWQTKLVAIIALVAVSFATGWRVHGWKTDAGQARSIAKTQKTAQKLQKAVDPIVVKKSDDIAKTEIIYRTIREKVNEKDDQRICFADTSAWSLYNSAITGTVPLRPEPAGKASGTGNTQGQGSEGQPDKSIISTEKDLLNNATNNYETCRKNMIKHNALIDAVAAVQDKLCVCAN